MQISKILDIHPFLSDCSNSNQMKDKARQEIQVQFFFFLIHHQGIKGIRDLTGGVTGGD